MARIIVEDIEVLQASLGVVDFRSIGNTSRTDLAEGLHNDSLLGVITIDVHSNFADPLDISLANVVDDVHFIVRLIDQLADDFSKDVALCAVHIS